MTNQELREYNKNREIVQICYVTRDLKRMLKDMNEVLGWGPFTIISLSDKSTIDVHVDGVKIDEPFEFLVAHTMVGAMQIEIIQPVSGANVYDRFLSEHGEGLHHIKEKVPEGKLPAYTEKIESKGGKTILSGGIDADRYIYYDLNKFGLSVLEIGNQPDSINVSYEVWPEE